MHTGQVEVSEPHFTHHVQKVRVKTEAAFQSF